MAANGGILSIVRGSHLGMGSFLGRGLAQFTPFRQYSKEGEGHPKGLGTREKLPLRAFPRLLVKGGGPGLPGSLLLQARGTCPSPSLPQPVSGGGRGKWPLVFVLCALGGPSVFQPPEPGQGDPWSPRQEVALCRGQPCIVLSSALLILA